MYRMESDELLDTVYNAISSIKDAMKELENIKEFHEDYIGLDVIRCSLQDRLNELEEIELKREREELEEANSEYYDNVL